MGGPLESYLDTHVAVWLAQGDLRRISRAAHEHIARSALLISPMVMIELQYLFQIKRISHNARDLQRKLEQELGVRVCHLSFPSIASVAIDEDWTREPFDRIIVAHAKANNFAYLISADENVRRFYPRAVW